MISRQTLKTLLFFVFSTLGFKSYSQDAILEEFSSSDSNQLINIEVLTSEDNNRVTYLYTKNLPAEISTYLKNHNLSEDQIIGLLSTGNWKTAKINAADIKPHNRIDGIDQQQNPSIRILNNKETSMILKNN